MLLGSRPVRVAVLVLLLGCGSSSTVTIDATAGDDAITPDAAPCGLRSGKRGKTNRELTIDGKKRTYIVYLPSGDDPQTPVPLVYVHHGYTMSGQNMFDLTEYAALADSEHIAVAFPDGQAGPTSTGAPWNVGTNVCPSYAGAPPVASGDDFELLDEMKADIAQDQCIDDKHIFVTGFSMGGYFSHHAGCMRDDIAAVAPHSGGTHPLDDCVTQKKPIIIFHGSADPVIPAGCNDPGATSVQNVVPAATAWATRNGCDLTTQTIAVENGTCRVYNNCPKGGQVELCTFTAMGHCWAGGPTGAGIYNCPTYADATALEWQFFKQYAWD
jgi:polyhydroxybutyrate depolymerase